MGLEKLEFDQIMSVSENNNIIIIGSWLTRVHQIMDALGKLLSTQEARVALGYHFV